jgi:hypothetical protein
MSWKRGFVFLLLALVPTMQADAQNPTRLPGVVVNAAPDLPGPRKIAGVVRDTTGFTVENVEISIGELRQRVYSKANGAFQFQDVKPGTYTARARKLGFAPQTREIKVDTAGGAVAFSLVPIPQTLLPVVSVASRGGLSGVVGDTGFKPIAGAVVQVVGHQDKTKTDSTGQFWMPVKPGQYMVSIEQAGYEFKVVSVTIPADSGRRITAYLPPLSRPRTVRQAKNLLDLHERLEGRSSMNSKVYFRDELLYRKVEWAWEAVQMAFIAAGGIGRGTLDHDCYAVKNGGPDIVSLADLTIDEIETIEVYAANRMPVSSGGRGMTPIGRNRASMRPVLLSNTREMAMANGVKNCAVAYVWLR